MKAIVIATVATLFCAATINAQVIDKSGGHSGQEMTEVEAPDTGASTASIEIAKKFTNAILGGKWKSTLTFEKAQEGLITTSADIAISMQDVKHFSISIASTVKAKDSSEVLLEENYKFMCDGEFLYIELDGIAEKSNGMFSGPIKMKFSEVLKLLGLGEAPTAEMMAAEAIAKVDSLIAAEKSEPAGLDYTEEGSTDELRRYTMGSEEGTYRVMCFYADTFLLASIKGKVDGEDIQVTTRDTAVVDEFAEGTFIYDKEAQDVTDMLVMMGGGEEAAPADKDLEF
jgi:hypothetical protein